MSRADDLIFLLLVGFNSSGSRPLEQTTTLRLSTCKYPTISLPLGSDAGPGRARVGGRRWRARADHRCSLPPHPRLLPSCSNATIEDPDFVASPPAPAASTSSAPSSALPPATPAHQSIASSSTAPPAAPNPRRTAGFNLSSADPNTGYSPEQLAQLQAILEGQVEAAGAGPNAAAGESG